MTAKLERRPVVEYREGPEGERGPRGPQGDRGPQGLPGKDGKDGRDGVNGINGRDGRDAPAPEPLDWKLEVKRFADKRIDYALMRSQLDDLIVFKPTYGSDGYIATADIQRMDGINT